MYRKKVQPRIKGQPSQQHQTCKKKITKKVNIGKKKNTSMIPNLKNIILPLYETSSSSIGRTGRVYGGALGRAARCAGPFDEESPAFSFNLDIW
jgi:hypothetical protein